MSKRLKLAGVLVFVVLGAAGVAGVWMTMTSSRTSESDRWLELLRHGEGPKSVQLASRIVGKASQNVKPDYVEMATRQGVARASLVLSISALAGQPGARAGNGETADGVLTG